MVVVAKYSPRKTHSFSSHTLTPTISLSPPPCVFIVAIVHTTLHVSLSAGRVDTAAPSAATNAAQSEAVVQNNVPSPLVLGTILVSQKSIPRASQPCLLMAFRFVRLLEASVNGKTPPNSALSKVTNASSTFTPQIVPFMRIIVNKCAF